MAHSCGSISVATASRGAAANEQKDWIVGPVVIGNSPASTSHFLPISSWTARVAIMTLGSLVLILAKSGTSFSVSVNLSRTEIMAWKQIRVLTLTERRVVLLNTVVIFGNRVCFTVV